MQEVFSNDPHDGSVYEKRTWTLVMPLVALHAHSWCTPIILHLLQDHIIVCIYVYTYFII